MHTYKVQKGWWRFGEVFAKHRGHHYLKLWGGALYLLQVSISIFTSKLIIFPLHDKPTFSYNI